MTSYVQTARSGRCCSTSLTACSYRIQSAFRVSSPSYGMAPIDHVTPAPPRIRSRTKSCRIRIDTFGCMNIVGHVLDGRARRPSRAEMRCHTPCDEQTSTASPAASARDLGRQPLGKVVVPGVVHGHVFEVGVAIGASRHGHLIGHGGNR